MIDLISLQTRSNLSTGRKITILLQRKKIRIDMITYNWKIEL